MFPPGTRRPKPGPFFMNSPMGYHPMGFNPFEYHDKYMQEENPFRGDFFSPLPPTGGQSLGQSQQQSPFQNQLFGHPPVHSQMPGQPTSGLQSLIRDQSGKIDFVKIGNGVQNVMGVVNQMGPIMKMFNGFFR